jgi:hypothetical protein
VNVKNCFVGTEIFIYLEMKMKFITLPAAPQFIEDLGECFKLTGSSCKTILTAFVSYTVDDGEYFSAGKLLIVY